MNQQDNLNRKVVEVDFKQKVVFDQEPEKILKRIQFLTWEIEKNLNKYIDLMKLFLERKLEILSRTNFDEVGYKRYEEQVLNRKRNLDIDLAYSHGIYLIDGSTQSQYTREQIKDYLDLLYLNKEFKVSIPHNVQLFEVIRDNILEITELGEKYSNLSSSNITRETLSNLPYIFFVSLDYLTQEQIEKILHVFYSIHFTTVKETV